MIAEMGPLPLLLGHRGTRANRAAPENTFAAFDEALVHGCDGFEFDVRATADGQAVVVHDPKWHGISVAEAKRKELDKLPLLKEVLQKYGTLGFLDIELKVTGLETEVLKLLREHPPQRNYVISSFLPEVVQELRVRRGALPLGIICDSAAQLKRGLELPTVYVILEEELVDKSLVQDIHGAGKKVLVWTVNQQAAMLRLANWNVDGIVSDDPSLLVRTLSPRNRHISPSD
jgi:glycerophosphoryl diester phosphodiesterase